MNLEIKKVIQKHILESYSDIFRVILFLGGQIHQSQMVYWLSGKKKNLRISEFINYCVDSGLLKIALSSHVKILYLTNPVYAHFDMGWRTYKYCDVRVKTGSLIMERFLREGYAGKEPAELVKRMLQTTARYNYPNAKLEYALLSSLIKSMPDTYDVSYLEVEKARMLKINQNQTHEDSLCMNLFQLAKKNIFISSIQLSEKELFIHADYFDIFDREAKRTAQLLLEAKNAINFTFESPFHKDYNTNICIEIHSHNEPNFKYLDKVFEHLLADACYIVNQEQVYKDFIFHHYRTNKSLFAGVNKVA